MEDIEKLAKRYARLRASKQRSDSDRTELIEAAATIVDSISSPNFAFPIKKAALESSGTTTYTYENNSAYPALFDFLAELLHTRVPIEIESTKFGPGEILVARGKRNEADIELALSFKELQKLVHARRAEILTKYGTATPP
ncbi:MAG TPA: hypothetical protein VLA68_03410 [Nitrososphaera sp.]|nr:hypothetical protein [Nitrososphaera sp.]